MCPKQTDDTRELAILVENVDDTYGTFLSKNPAEVRRLSQDDLVKWIDEVKSKVEALQEEIAPDPKRDEAEYSVLTDFIKSLDRLKKSLETKDPSSSEYHEHTSENSPAASPGRYP